MSHVFDELVALVATLRGPTGCSWDRGQTHDSLKPYLVEETYEVLEALDRNDPCQLRDELGDLLLQVLLHADIERAHTRFTIQDVITALQKKLVRRHPHVFGEGTRHALNTDQVINQWEQIKQAERARHSQNDSILQGVPASLPALLRAYHVQKRASRVGFDWDKPEHVLDKLNEELHELQEVTSRHESLASSCSLEHDPESSYEAIEQEFGDVLFTIANVSRFLAINPEESLRKACNRFVARFAHMEQQAAKEGKALQQLTATEWATLWEAAKQHESATQHRPSSS